MADIYSIYLRRVWFSMTSILVDAIDASSLFIIRSVQFTLVPLKPLLTGLITNLDTRGNSSRPEILETLKKVEFTVILDICWDTPTEAVDLINGSICPWSSCSGDDIHERIMLTFVEHVSSSSPPSHTTAPPEGDSTNPVESHIIQQPKVYRIMIYVYTATWPNFNLQGRSHAAHEYWCG
jgi:hypothetical protein